VVWSHRVHPRVGDLHAVQLDSRPRKRLRTAKTAPKSHLPVRSVFSPFCGALQAWEKGRFGSGLDAAVVPCPWRLRYGRLWHLPMLGCVWRPPHPRATISLIVSPSQSSKSAWTSGLSTVSPVPQSSGGIFMTQKTRTQNLTGDKIVDLLAKADIHVTGDQAAAIERYVRAAGGLDQARFAVEKLDELITAACRTSGECGPLLPSASRPTACRRRPRRLGWPTWNIRRTAARRPDRPPQKPLPAGTRSGTAGDSSRGLSESGRSSARKPNRWADTLYKRHPDARLFRIRRGSSRRATGGQLLAGVTSRGMRVGKGVCFVTVSP